MRKLPCVLASSVIRGAQLGESHGGIYLVDLDHGSVQLKLDWNRSDIDFEGRGGDRGLRGIAFHGEQILIAANSELLVLDQDFRLIESFTNPYLRHCHEISVANGRAFLTATGFDSVLIFRSREEALRRGLAPGRDGPRHAVCAISIPRRRPVRRRLTCFISIPSRHRRPGIWFSGLNTPGLFRLDGRTLSLASELPPGTHNAQMLGDGVLYNDTAGDRVCFRRNGATIALPVPDFAPGEIVNLERYASEVARPRFARGLCVLDEELIAGGSSPSTISVYSLRDRKRVMQRNLSMDVRNAIHGLAVWPYS